MIPLDRNIQLDPYLGREQTKAKHFILERYLQALAFKVLRYWDLAYVDGFSGPWMSERKDFSDTSFMIAISVLKDAQQRIFVDTGRRPKVKCFFSELNSSAFAQLNTAVSTHHDPAALFEVRTFQGTFEDAVPEVSRFVGTAFPLVFIDPTGWTGYPLARIGAIFDRPKCEVIVNFMYSFVRRFVEHPDEKITASLDPILGGPGWRSRLDPCLDLGLAIEKLFRESLKEAGNFAHVVSTRIDRSTEDRPHFFLAYGTKNRAGLKTFRQTEYDALRLHARSRSAAKARKRDSQTGSADLFSDFDADVREASVDDIVIEQKRLAKQRLLAVINDGQMAFVEVVDLLLQEFFLRETNVRDLCVELSKDGKVENTWGSGNRKPTDTSPIRLLTV